MSTRKKPPAEAEPKAPLPRTKPGGTEDDIARARELIEKHGLQRLLHTKR